MSALASQTQADAIARHLRRAEGKGPGHSMRNVDFVYMINLDARPEKYALARRFLEVHAITPHRFAAINGWELSKQAIHDVSLKFQPGMTPLLATRYPDEIDELIPSHEFMTEPGQGYLMHCMPLGAIGCVLSHLSVLRDAWESGYETIWVLEDDIEVLGDPHQISELLPELDALTGTGGWDVLFTDVDYRSPAGEYLTARGAAKRPDCDCTPQGRLAPQYTETVQLNEHFRRVAARFGSTSMILRRSGIAKLLSFFMVGGLYGPYDLDNLLPRGIRRYGLTFDLVTNMRHSISDVGALAHDYGELNVGSLLSRYPGPVYQDLVVGESTLLVGTDRCEPRYELIKPVLARHDGPFSVLDIGAAQGYFSFTIAREHPRSSCVMVEADDTSYYSHHGSMLRELCLMNRERENVVLLERRLTIEDLELLAATEHFDVVLALLVVHLMAESLAEQARIVELILGLADDVIVEVAGEVGVTLTAYVEYLQHALGGELLGEVRRHKDPSSTATGRLIHFRRVKAEPFVEGRSARGPHAISRATFERLGGVHPAIHAGDDGRGSSAEPAR